MSSDSGIRKRNKDKKKKKGSTGDVNIPAQAAFREPPSMKLVIDETIHVPNDRNFGGNWCSKLIFLVFLIAIAGLLFFALSNFNLIRVGEKREPIPQEEVDDSESWLAKLVNFNYFSSSNEPSEVVDDEESPPDVQPQPSYLDILWELYPFGGSEEPPPELSPNEVTDRSEESRDGRDSREIDESKETNAEDENNDTNQDEDQDNKESEENEDDEEKENDDDDEENDNDNLSTDYDDIPKPFNPYGYRYERDEPDEKNSKEDEEDESRTSEDDENDSPSKSDEEPELDGLDNRYNYYHSRHQSFEDEKYNYIRDDDDVNDSAEKGAQERFDSGENKKDTPQNEENDPEPDSHSSEEDEHDDKPVSKESEEDKEPQVEEKEDHGESGNMITKLSVGTALIFVAYSVIIRKWNNYVNRVAQEAEAILNNGGDAQNDENADSIAQAVFENVMDLLNDDVNDLKDRLEKNKTLQEYLETPSGSENEQSEDDSVNWQAQGHTPLDLEESETASETGDETENSESETNTSSKYTGNYDRANITNQYDWRHREEIDDADDDLDHGRITMALEKYEKILKIEPFSVRAKYGMAKCMDKKAEIQKSNQLLGKVIELYVEALQMPDVPLSLAKMIAERVLDRMRFKGDYMNSIRVQKNLVERFPEEMNFHNELAVSYLILNRISDAKIVLENILEKWPDNGLALVNYGFVLKMMGDLERAVEFLSRGIETNESATQDSRFYFHLGDALQKLNRKKEAMKVYEEGAEKGIFLSKYQRSLYNVDRLTAKPWWTIEETKYQDFFRKLISNWKVIRDEALQVLKRERNAAFREESEQLREAGDWRQFEIFSRGVQKPQCKKVPVTCRIVSNFPPAAGCRRGQVKFSLMEPGTHVWPHCGPTNCRLRAHLGLVIPANVSIRVAEEVRSWKEGEVLILDDSFEHEVWHNGTSSRLILIVDVWHPELTAQERRTLTAI